MLPTDWHKVLPLILLISPHVLLGVLAVILYRRRIYRELPCFFAYALFELFKFVPLFVLYSKPGAGRLYLYGFSATLMVSIALRFGVIDEVSKNLFRDSASLKVAARRALQGVTGLLLMVGVLLGIYAPGENTARWIAGLSVVNRGAALVQCGLLLSLLLFSRFLGVAWRRAAFGVTLGFGVLTSVDLATSALRAQFTGRAVMEFSNLVVTGTYLICVLIWIGYALAPEPEPAFLALGSPNLLSHDLLSHAEVETWNTELQHLLRD